MIGIIVCCCKKYHENYKKCAKRWADVRKKYPFIKFFYVFGTPGQTKYTKKTARLNLDVEDEYEALPKKICKAMKYIVENHPEINGIFKTDDDIDFFDYDKLIMELKLLSESDNNYAGITIDVCGSCMIHELRLAKFCKLDENQTYSYDKATYCYGGGYYVSRSAAIHICENEKFICERYLEDVTIGHILNKYNIYPIKMQSEYKELPRDTAHN